MNRGISIMVVFLTIGLRVATSAAMSLSCDGGTVDESDSKYEITKKCGDPTVTHFTKISRLFKSSKVVTQEFVDVEEWLFNFGPQRLMIVMTFENDDLIGIRHFGYGCNESDIPNFGRKVDIGTPAVLLLFLYGIPSHKEERVETIMRYYKDGAPIPTTAHIETWTYDLGHNRSMRIFHIRNGRIVRITSGNRGF